MCNHRDMPRKVALSGRQEPVLQVSEADCSFLSWAKASWGYPLPFGEYPKGCIVIFFGFSLCVHTEGIYLKYFRLKGRQNIGKEKVLSFPGPEKVLKILSVLRALMSHIVRAGEISGNRSSFYFNLSFV